ncbi:hypothetical protein [Flavobacterium sp.]|uniref:hypothetical protein n=1 Tax=Flavobacterium sp. TaxID=239 RepID=UPI004048599C
MDIDNKNTLENLCEKHSIWIIKYISKTYICPLFLIWYRDNEGTERLLSYKNEKTFTTSSLKNLKEKIQSLHSELVLFEGLDVWLEEANDFTIVATNNYNVKKTIKCIRKDNFGIEVIEEIINFISLFDNFVYQDQDNNFLQIHLENNTLEEIVDYYYNCIFWPRFYEKDKFDASTRPSLEINKKELVNQFNEIVEIFETSFKLI